MSKWLTSLAVVFVGVSLAGGTSPAGEEQHAVSARSIPAQKFAAVEADKAISPLSALKRAAERGELDAQYKLARIYAAGEGVSPSQLKAFDLFQNIVGSFAEVHPRDARASRVADAFVALGNYFRTGISGTAIKADKRRAASLYRHAASYLGDAEAQCNLAQMYLLGEGVPRNGRFAVNWLANAAKKRHARAQAILGDLLWRGADDVRRQPRKGLALLTIARQNAGDAAEARWIETLYDSASAYSQSHERTGAERLAARWQASIGRPSALVSASVAPAKEPKQPLADEVGARSQSESLEGISNISLDTSVRR